MSATTSRSPIKRIHAKLLELIPEAEVDGCTTEELVDALIAAYVALREEHIPPAEGNPMDYHRLPTWTGGVIGWAVPDGTTRTHPGHAVPAPMLPPTPRPIRPARP